MSKEIFAIESCSFYDMEGLPYFLAWQPNEWDDGYFWTRKSIFLKLMQTEYNVDPHKFTFASEEEAIKFAKKDKLKNYKIVKLEGWKND